MSGGAATLGILALEEVRLCHAFFQDRFAGRTDPAALDARLQAFSDEFLRVAPDGSLVTCGDLRSFLERRHDEEAGTGFSIHIENETVVWESADAALVSYVERQSSRGVSSRRLATALFIASPHPPGGVQWRHLQETMIPSPQTAGEPARPNP